MSNQEKPISQQSGDDLADLPGRLCDKLDQCQKETQSTKKVARIMVILVVLSAVLGIYIILSPFLQIYKHPEPYQTALLDEFQKRVLPEVQKETEAMIKEAGPDIWEDVRDKVNVRLPDIAMKVEKEWNLFMENLATKIKERFIVTGEEFTELLQQRLKQEIPLAADAQKAELIMANAQKAAENAVGRILEEYFTSHIDTVTRIENRIADFPVPADLKDKDDTQLTDLLTTKMTDFLSQSIQLAPSPGMEQFLQEYTEE